MLALTLFNEVDGGKMIDDTDKCNKGNSEYEYHTHTREARSSKLAICMYIYNIYMLCHKLLKVTKHVYNFVELSVNS